MLAIDCNVLVHLLLEGERTDDARALIDMDPDWRSEPFVLIELSNVLATWIRTRGLTLDDALLAFAQAHAVLEGGLQAASHRDALSIAARYRITAYDARYLAMARDLGVRLVTEDVKLRRAAPELTHSLAEALSGK